MSQSVVRLSCHETDRRCPQLKQVCTCLHRLLLLLLLHMAALIPYTHPGLQTVSIWDASLQVAVLSRYHSPYLTHREPLQWKNLRGVQPPRRSALGGRPLSFFPWHGGKNVMPRPRAASSTVFPPNSIKDQTRLNIRA